MHMHYFGQTMFTDLYSSTGAYVSTAPSRVDYWDNGHQAFTVNGLLTQYTIAPGQSLQTHCYYNTQYQSSTVSFGPATPNEMCMNFLFYYPAQFIGVDVNNNPARASYCGYGYFGSGSSDTVCGGPDMTPANSFIMSSPNQVVIIATVFCFFPPLSLS